MFDLIIRGGAVYDGTGRPARWADVAVSGGKATLKFDGETTATQKHYKYNAALSLKAGDRVKVNKISGTYVIEYKL